MQFQVGKVDLHICFLGKSQFDKIEKKLQSRRDLSQPEVELINQE